MISSKDMHMDPSMLSERLEEYDFLRVARELNEYSQAGANRVHLTLPSTASLFGSFVSIRVEFQPDALIQSAQGDRRELLEAWIDWPPSRSGTHRKRRGISVTRTHVTIGDSIVTGIEIQTLEDRTTFILPTGFPKTLSEPLVVEFSTPSVYFLLPGREPFSRSLLNLNLNLLAGADKTILYLDHPSVISLRARVDNSEYHSLAYAAEANAIRKITFFSGSSIRIRYFWGLNDAGRLMAPSVPLYASGVSLVAAAFTLALVEARLSDLASAVLAFALLPPFFQLLSQRRLMFPSADISRFSVDGWTALIALGLYVPLIALTGLSLAFFPDLRLVLRGANLALGVIFILSTVVYVLLVQNGFFQHYACDVCERRIWWRRGAHLHVSTRRTLCETCWRSQLTAEAADKSEPKRLPNSVAISDVSDEKRVL